MQASKAKGNKLGRKNKLDLQTQQNMINDFIAGMIYDDLVVKYKVSRPTVASICKPHSAKRRSRTLALKRAELKAIQENIL